MNEKDHSSFVSAAHKSLQKHKSLSDSINSKAIDSSSNSNERSTEKKDPQEEKKRGDAAAPASKPPFLYCINFVKTRKDSALRRGAAVKALALCSTKPYFYVFKKLLMQAIEVMYDMPNPEEEMKRLFDAINALDLSKCPTMSELKKKVWRYCIMESKPLFYSAKLRYLEKDSQVSIPLALHPDEIGDERVSVIKLIQKFREQVMVLFNAILCEKRVLFLGYGQSSADVCLFVLASALLAAPPLRGLMETRLFPYASLVNLQFLSE